MNSKKTLPGLFWLGVFIVVILSLPEHSTLPIEEGGMVQGNVIYGVAGIACDSDSMGLTLDCTTTVKYHYVQEGEKLTLGKLYIYDSPYGDHASLLHRLVGCLTCVNGTLLEECYADNSYLLFKGDNNRLIDSPIRYTAQIRLRQVNLLNMS